MSKKKKTQKIGKINPNKIKSRDIVHMQEFLANKGGPHQDKRRQRKHKRKDHDTTSDQEAQGDG
jgi:hypothetical protein